MENYNREDVLYHYGRLGMKWYQNIFTKGKNKGQQQAKKEEESPEQKKERILKSHSAKEIYNNKDLFTDKEIQDAYNRLNNEKNIKNLIPEDVSRGQKFIDDYANMSKNIKTIVDSSDDLYKSYQKGHKLVKTLLDATKKVK